MKNVKNLLVLCSLLSTGFLLPEGEEPMPVEHMTDAQLTAKHEAEHKELLKQKNEQIEKSKEMAENRRLIDADSLNESMADIRKYKFIRGQENSKRMREEANSDYDNALRRVDLAHESRKTEAERVFESRKAALNAKHEQERNQQKEANNKLDEDWNVDDTEFNEPSIEERKKDLRKVIEDKTQGVVRKGTLSSEQAAILKSSMEKIIGGIDPQKFAGNDIGQIAKKMSTPVMDELEQDSSFKDLMQDPNAFKATQDILAGMKTDIDIQGLTDFVERTLRNSESESSFFDNVSKKDVLLASVSLLVVIGIVTLIVESDKIEKEFAKLKGNDQSVFIATSRFRKRS